MLDTAPHRLEVVAGSQEDEQAPQPGANCGRHGDAQPRRLVETLDPLPSASRTPRGPRRPQNHPHQHHLLHALP